MVQYLDGLFHLKTDLFIALGVLISSSTYAFINK